MVYGANVLANWLYSLEVFHTFHGKQPSFLYQRFLIGLSIVHFNNFKRIERTIHSSFQDKTAFSKQNRGSFMLIYLCAESIALVLKGTKWKWHYIPERITII